jgi:hypothetical protein
MTMASGVQDHMHGPFHRLESPTQTSADALKQVASSEVWGAAARWSNIPSVKAYRNSLPTGQRGIEFSTIVLPQKGSGTPYEARWYYPHTPGVQERTKNGQDHGGERFWGCPQATLALLANAQRQKMRSNKRDELTTNGIADAVLDRQRERYLIDF